MDEQDRRPGPRVLGRETAARNLDPDGFARHRPIVPAGSDDARPRPSARPTPGITMVPLMRNHRPKRTKRLEADDAACPEVKLERIASGAGGPGWSRGRFRWPADSSAPSCRSFR